MKIMHCCLSCFYIDSFTYQENMLVREHVKLGHDVLVVASTESYSKDGSLTYLNPSRYIGTDNAEVIRLPYVSYLPSFLAKKIRAYEGLNDILKNFNPDIIVFHGPCAFALLNVVNYIKSNTNTKLFVDSHEDFNNSATSFISRIFLYKLFYKQIITLSKRFVSKFLYITPETKKFCQDIYGLEESKLEYFPLGGNLFNDEIYFKKRYNFRHKYDLNNDVILFVQTGKFDSKKKLKDSLQAFSKIDSPDIRFFIAGVVPPEYENEINQLINQDSRVLFIGWVDSQDLQNLLCASDVYVQPGSQSATLQLSIACRCSIIVDDVSSHHVLVKDNGFLLNNEFSLEQAFYKLANNKSLVTNMSISSFNFAEQNLDYSKLALRLLN